MELTQTYSPPDGFFKRLSILDWLFAFALVAGSLFALGRYGTHMDYYEKGVLLLAAPTFALVGWNWKSVRWLMPLLAVPRVALAKPLWP